MLNAHFAFNEDAESCVDFAAKISHKEFEAVLFCNCNFLIKAC